MSGQIDALRRLTATVLEIELARLAGVNNRTEALTLRLDQIGQAVSSRASDVTRAASRNEEADLALVAGRDASWLAWTHVQKKDLNTELAQVAAEREMQLARTRRALGRVQAIDALSRKMCIQAAVRAGRRGGETG